MLSLLEIQDSMLLLLMRDKRLGKTRCAFPKNVIFEVLKYKKKASAIWHCDQSFSASDARMWATTNRTCWRNGTQLTMRLVFCGIIVSYVYSCLIYMIIEYFCLVSASRFCGSNLRDARSPRNSWWPQEWMQGDVTISLKSETVKILCLDSSHIIGCMITVIKW